MVNINMHVFKHPKFYEEFRQRAKRCQKELKASLEKKSDQVISQNNETSKGGRAPGQGQSSKLQAPSVKLSNQPVQASSDKRQALRCKRQA